MTFLTRAFSPSRAWRIAYACLALRMLATIGPGLAGTAMIRLFEATVCRRYYRQFDASAINFNDNVPEMKCKVAGVQSEMSKLQGIDSLISIIPMIIAALPYLIWSRIVNKKLLLLIYYVGFLAGFLFSAATLYFYNTLDIRWIWLTNVFTLIGGGHLVFRSLVSSIAAEALPKESLTAYYLYSSAILLITDVISITVGLQLMQRSLWSAVVLGIGFHMLSIPVLSFLDDNEPLTNLPHSTPSDSKSEPRSFWSEAMDIRKQGGKLLATARQHSFYILIFLVHKCGSSVEVLLPQWMSKRYEKTLREIGYVSLGKQIWITVVLLSIPQLHKYLERRAPNSKDSASLSLIRWSVIASLVGVLLLSFSWALVPAVISLAVSAIGSGFYDILLGFVTMELERMDLVQVYMCISIVEDMGGRIAGTVVFAIYGLAVEMNSFFGMSLPLWVCAGFFGAVYLLLRRL